MNSVGRPWMVSPASGTLPAARNDGAEKRRRALKRVDIELSRRNFKAALSLVKQLRRQPGHGLRFFGAAKQMVQMPMTISVMEGLELNGIDFRNFQSTLDCVMDSIERCRQFALLEQDSMKGSGSLVYEEGNGSSCEEDHFQCAQVGVGKMKQEVIKNNEIPKHVIDVAGMYCDNMVQGSKGKVSSKTLNNFSSVVLGGLVAEHMLFGYSEGLHSDVDKLDRVLSWSGYSESEAHSQVRWAAANAIYTLHHHSEAVPRLAEAMALGRSVGCCISTIEDALDKK